MKAPQSNETLQQIAHDLRNVSKRFADNIIDKKSFSKYLKDIEMKLYLETRYTFQDLVYATRNL